MYIGLARLSSGMKVVWLKKGISISGDVFDLLKEIVRCDVIAC